MIRLSTIRSYLMMPRLLVVFRLVSVCLLGALLWKWEFFVHATRVYAYYPVSDSFFPTWLQSTLVLRVTFLVVISAISLGMVTPKSWVRKIYSVITLIGATILVIHQGSYNDMTFATAWWTSLWMLWLTFQFHPSTHDHPGTGLSKPDEALLLRRAAFLSRLICSMILLGGAVGKWTGEYWSGQVLYDIYFVDRDFWLFNLLRSNFDEPTLREIAMWYSRKVIAIETIAGFGMWLLPARYAGAIGVLLFTSIAVLSNFLLFSVLLSLIGLAAVGLFVTKPIQPDPLVTK